MVPDGGDEMRLNLNRRASRRQTEEAAGGSQAAGPIRFGDEGRQRGCAHGGEVRCGCGSLLARVVGGEVELKCRRCKQVWTIPLDPG